MEAMNVNIISSKVSGRVPCHQEWFCTASGNVGTLRIETRCDGRENEEEDEEEDGNGDRVEEGKERILLFRSNRRGAVGKVIFSYRVCLGADDGCCGGAARMRMVRATIQVVDVKDGTWSARRV